MGTITFCNYNYIGFRFSVTVKITLPVMSITITITFVNYNYTTITFYFQHKTTPNHHSLYFLSREDGDGISIKNIFSIL